MDERLTVGNVLRSNTPTDEPEPYPCYRPSEVPLTPASPRICPIACLFDFTTSTHFHVISCSLFLIPLPPSSDAQLRLPAALRRLFMLSSNKTAFVKTKSQPSIRRRPATPGTMSFRLGTITDRIALVPG